MQTYHQSHIKKLIDSISISTENMRKCINLHPNPHNKTFIASPHLEGEIWVFSGWGWGVVNLWYITAVLHPISYHTGPRYCGTWLYIGTQIYCLTTIYGRVSGNAFYSDIIISAIASQITSLTIACSTVYSGTDHRQHLVSASLAFVRGIHQWPVNSPHKGPVTQKMFPFDDIIMSP